MVALGISCRFIPQNDMGITYLLTTTSLRVRTERCKGRIWDGFLEGYKLTIAMQEEIGKLNSSDFNSSIGNIVTAML